MNRRKSIVLIAMVALLLTFTVSGTIAWLAASTDPVVNTFTPGQIQPDIVEEIEGNTKKSIKVTNTGNVDAYIRVAIVANWCDANNNVVCPYTGTISITTDWFEQDGYYYHKAPVAGNGGTTSELLASPIGWNTGSLAKIQETYPNANKLVMTVITQSIQADGTTTVNGTVVPVVTAEWGVKVENRNLTPNS